MNMLAGGSVMKSCWVLKIRIFSSPETKKSSPDIRVNFFIECIIIIGTQILHSFEHVHFGRVMKERQCRSSDVKNDSRYLGHRTRLMWRAKY